jgi:acyl carrier protein
MDNTTFKRIQSILTDKFSVPAENIHPDTKLENLGLDSLDLIELLFEVEEAFDIRVPQDGAAAIRTATVQDMIDNVDRLVAAPHQLQPEAGA